MQWLHPCEPVLTCGFTFSSRALGALREVAFGCFWPARNCRVSLAKLGWAVGFVGSFLMLGFSFNVAGRMTETSLIQQWIDCLSEHAGRLRSGDFDLDKFKEAGAPIVSELKEIRDEDGRIGMPKEYTQDWADANTEFAGAAQDCMNVLAMVAYAEFIEELTGKKILPEPGETKPPSDN
jgi:hypothetical protein